jgi:hypothetical protein
MTAWKNLRHVALYKLNFDPQAFCDLAILRQLARIDFDGKYLTDDLVDCLSAFDHLEVISLEGDDVASESVNRLKAVLPQVTVLGAGER